MLRNKRYLWIWIALILILASTISTNAQSPETSPDPALPLANKYYLPILLKSLDLTIIDLEITQATQNTSDDIPLVEGRRTVVRVFAKTDDKNPTSNIKVSISAEQDGVLLPGAPLNIGPKSVSTNPVRADINTTFNIELPLAWLSGQVQLEAMVDADNVEPEFNESNNVYTQTLTFNPVPPLDVMLVPIKYYDISGLVFPKNSQDIITTPVMDIYPVGSVTVTKRTTTMSFSGDLTQSIYWNALIDNVITAKEAANAPDSQVWYGVIPVEDGSGNTWFPGSGYVGLGTLGAPRVAIGLADSPNYGIDGEVIAAHEIGHTLNREHSPCGVTPYDQNYPYPNGKIGQYGFSTRYFVVVPNNYKDIMSYCSPMWISDYTYKKMYNDQVAHGMSTPVGEPEASLLFRAILDGNGDPTLLPSYAFEALPSTIAGNSDYAVEFLDSAGNKIAQSPLDTYSVAEPGIQFTGINFVIPLPVHAYAAIRLVKSGDPLAETKLAGNPDAPLPTPSIEQSSEGTSLRWGMPATPALVRFTNDGGETWQVLGVDVTGGRLSLESAELPPGNLLFEIILADSLSEPLQLNWQNNPSLQ